MAGALPRKESANAIFQQDVPEACGRRFAVLGFRVSGGLGFTYSLHCSSFFGLTNFILRKDPKR